MIAGISIALFSAIISLYTVFHNIDEITPITVLAHYEGYQAELASFHRDPEDFFSSYGKTMKDFRKELNNKFYLIS